MLARLGRGMALGVTQQLPEEERHSYSKEYLDESIVVAMGGRVAEKIVFGHLNSGAANDLEQATSIARRMVREWGMSDAVGPMAWSGHQQVFLGEDLMQSREYSDELGLRIDEETALILRAQEQRARELLELHRDGLEAVTKALLEHETIDGATVGQLVDDAHGTPIYDNPEIVESFAASSTATKSEPAPSSWPAPAPVALYPGPKHRWTAPWSACGPADSGPDYPNPRSYKQG